MSFPTQCFFEYGQRWPELRTYIERITNAGDENRPALDVILEALEQRDRDIEDHLNNRPCGGATVCGFTGSDATGDVTFTTTVTFDSPVTVKVDAVVTAEDFAGLSLLPYVDGLNVTGPSTGAAAIDAGGGDYERLSVGLTYVYTFDAGEHEFGVEVTNVTTGNDPGVTATVTYVVATSTGCDTVTVGGGA